MLKSERKALRYMLMGETPMPPVQTKSLPARGRWDNPPISPGEICGLKAQNFTFQLSSFRGAGQRVCPALGLISQCLFA